mgnify:CR=1 FL=1
MGFTLEDIGWLLGTVGFVAGLVGAVLAGALANRLGRKRSLVMFGLFQALTVGGYAYMAAVGPSRDAIYALCALEHLAGGMATVALFTCMMDWCSTEQAASDYTAQASAVVITTGTATLLAGVSADQLGYTAHFALAALLSLAAQGTPRYAYHLPTVRERAGQLKAIAAVDRHYFAVIHAGDGDGWDFNRPAMGSVLIHQGRYAVPRRAGAFTGHQSVYEPVRDGELQYWCEWINAR